MLKPYMSVLTKKVGNRYLLVNVCAKRARDIAENAEQEGEEMMEKPVKTALCELAEDKIHFVREELPEED